MSSRIVGNAELPSRVGEGGIDDSLARRGPAFWAARGDTGIGVNVTTRKQSGKMIPPS